MVLSIVVILVMAAAIVVRLVADHRDRRLSVRAAEVLEDAAHQDLLARGRLALAGRRVALVLAGGGGKGAYEIGCWRALRALGVTGFNTISGTSVGALNAALVAQGRFEAAESIWASITTDGVLRLSLPNVAKRGALLVVMWPLYAIKYLRGSSTLFLAARDYRRDQERHGIAAFAALTATVRHLLAGRGLVDAVVPLSIIVVAGSLGSRLVVDPDVVDAASETLAALVVTAGLLTVVVIVWAALVRLDVWLAEDVPLASNSPLGLLLRDHVDPDMIRATAPPTFVTVASLRHLVAPDPVVEEAPSPDVAADPGPGPQRQGTLGRVAGRLRGLMAVAGDDFGPRRAETSEPGAAPDEGPTGRLAFVPSYFRLSDCSDAVMHALVLQSGGLPELFPRRRILGDAYVDGGIADNTPLLPALTVGDPDVVVIVSLDHRATWAAQRRQDRRILRTAARAVPLEDQDDTAAPVLTPLELTSEAPPVPASAYLIRPSTHLGGLIRGTLGFSPDRSRRLMDLGYLDALRALAGEPVARR